MKIPDLWPEDINDESNLVMPIQILREQAAALTQRTKGIIEGEVRSPKSSDDSFVHEFVLVAPTLDGYAHRLIVIIHTIAGYPVEVHSRALGKRRIVDSQDDFLGCLREIFNHPETKQIIQALIAQSKS